MPPNPCVSCNACRCAEATLPIYLEAGTRFRLGQELSSLAVIDQTDKVALHLEAVQTLDLRENESLVDFNVRIITHRTKALQRLSCLLLTDACFSKRKFIHSMQAAGFHVVTRLCKDARLRYLYHCPRRFGEGRPKTYDGCISVRELRENQVRSCAKADNGSWVAYELIADVQAWEQTTRVVIIHELKQDISIKMVRILACTILSKDDGEVLLANPARFQIELLYRDANSSECQPHYCIFGQSRTSVE